MTTRLGGQSTAQVRLAAAGGARDQHAVVLMYPTTAEQVSELALVQAARMAIIDILWIRLQLEPGLQQ